jgi:hypothetical protein
MHVEVDQSGKVEDTATDTVLAFANGEHFAILIRAREKRICLHALRARGKTGKSIYRLLFATALFLLLKNHVRWLHLITIDVEYVGGEANIKEHVLNLLRRDGNLVDTQQIQFTRIGKKSPAHTRAYTVHRGDRKPDLIVTADDLLREL